MNDHPVNLAVRFLLEIAVLIILGYWGWQRGEGVMRWLLMLGLPMLAMLIWGVFRVPNDPGNAVVAIPGLLRLLIEFIFFASAVLALYQLEVKPWYWVLAVIVIVHYLVSYDRVLWIVKQ